MATFLKLLPALISFGLALFKLWRDWQAKGVAMDSVVADVLSKTVTDIAKAAEAAHAAQLDHLNKSDDTAFDPDFKRSGP